MIPSLHADTIYQALDAKTRRMITTLEILPRVDSTNAYLISKPNIKSGHVCLAEEQTAGRGQHEKTWVSPPASNIYLSLSWRFPHATTLSGLSLIIGIAVVQALHAMGITHLKLKWPNDVWYFQRKLAGILIETIRDQENILAIIGIGLNVNMTQTLHATIDQPWIDIQTIIDTPANRNQITALLLSELCYALLLFTQKGFHPFMPQWQQLDGLAGQSITVRHNNREISGIAAGIDQQGNLIVQYNNEQHTFTAGEIRMRHPHDLIS